MLDNTRFVILSRIVLGRHGTVNPSEVEPGKKLLWGTVLVFRTGLALSLRLGGDLVRSGGSKIVGITVGNKEAVNEPITTNSKPTNVLKIATHAKNRRPHTLSNAIFFPSKSGKEAL